MPSLDQFKISLLALLENVTANTSKEDDLNTVMKIKEKLFEEPSHKKLWVSPVNNKFFRISLGMFISFTFLIFAIEHKPFVESTIESTNHKYFDYVDIFLYGIWTIAPPLFFLYEYVILFGKKKANRLDAEQCADLKYCQDLGAKIWTAVILVFGILLYLRYGLKL